MNKTAFYIQFNIDSLSMGESNTFDMTFYCMTNPDVKVTTTFTFGSAWFKGEINWDVIGQSVFESLISEALDSNMPFEEFASELFNVNKELAKYVEKKVFGNTSVFKQAEFDELKNNGFFEIDENVEEAITSYLIVEKFNEIFGYGFDMPPLTSEFLYTLRDYYSDDELVKVSTVFVDDMKVGWVVIVDIEHLEKLSNKTGGVK